MRQISWGNSDAAGSYRVTSYGNGTAYTLSEINKESGAELRSVFLQGDDAAAWREGYESACNRPGFIRETLNERT